jgi:hypothetical protein
MDKTPSPLITTVAPAEVDRAVAAIVLAFGADPVARWQYGDDAEQYLMHFPPFVRAFGGKAFAQGTAQHVNSYAGVALWLPPNIHPDEEAIVASLPTERRQRRAKSSNRWPATTLASPLVSAAHWRRSGPTKQGLWLSADGRGCSPVRSGSRRRVPRVHQSRQYRDVSEAWFCSSNASVGPARRASRDVKPGATPGHEMETPQSLTLQR